ncbi:PKD domain-containing protein [candidate division KSB1 bacterium]|nr:PKD domain-containing protein [candidate division KSB1 bacterium]
MKQLCYAAACLFLQLALLAMPLFAQTWSDPIAVPGGTNPLFDVDKETGDMFIVSMYNGVMLSKFDKDGNFISEENVPGTTGDQGGGYWGACAAIDRQGYPHVIYRQFLGGHYYSGYYKYKSAAGWSNPILIYSNEYRAYQPKIDIDELGRAHITWGHGGLDYLGNPAPGNIFGPIYYRRIENGEVTAQKDEMWWYRGDVNYEMMCTNDGEVHVSTGKADYPAEGGYIGYYRSLDEGVTWEGFGDKHDENALGANGYVDIFVDKQKHVHTCYGNEIYRSCWCSAVHYMRLRNDGTKVRDVVVTDPHEIEGVELGLPISSVAASEDGQYVVIAYLANPNESVEGEPAKLYTRLSTDGGATWGAAQLIANEVYTSGGRSRHYVRAYRHRFFLVYPYSGIQMRIYQVEGFEGPRATANGPYTGDEGESIQFSAAGSDDDSGIAMYAWDWNNDGTFDDSTTSETISYTYTDDYSGNVVLRVRGNSGNMSTATATVTIANVAPSVDLGSNRNINEGAELNLAPDIDDPGTEDQLTYQWNFGDGHTSTAENPGHTYSDNGTFTVTLTVSDDDGGETQDQVSVEVHNMPPIAEAGGPYTIRPGDQLSVNGSAEDPGADDVLSYAWDMDNNGTYEVEQQQATKTFSTNGIYTIRLQVTDDDGGIGLDDAKVVVGSAAPVITTIPNQTIQEGTAFETIKLDDFVTDPDDADDALTWSSQGNLHLNVAIANRVATVTPPNVDWTGSETILFIVTDPGGEADSANVKFTVTGVNDPPVVNQIPNQTRAEGIAFNPIQLDIYVYDIDNMPDEMSWSATGNSNLEVTINNRIATIAPADSEWAGSEAITFKATDPGGLSGSKTATFTVTAVNDPPQISGFQNQEIDQFQSFPQINLDECVFDPDNLDSQLSWTYFGNSHISLSITNRVLTATVNDPEWYGSETVTFVVTDPGQTQSSKNVIFKVNKVDAAPRISHIESQAIDEGETFAPIDLDENVDDINHSDSQLSWSWSGQVSLTPQLNGHTLTIAIPNTDWFGEETIRLIVQDPAGLSDTAMVTFTVRAVNDPPVISGLPDVAFNEDSYYEISLGTLQSHTTDVDNPVNDLAFGIQSSGQILGEYDAGTSVLRITTVPNYSGVTSARITATDPGGGIGMQEISVTVNALPDPPQSFNLIQPVGVDLVTWLPKFEFIWQHSIDPDPGDYVTYRWVLSRNPALADTFMQVEVGSDSVFVPVPTRRMYKGDYYWKIIASSSDGSVCESAIAKFSLLFTAIEDNPSTDTPHEFALLPNHPNPFNPETKITYHLPEACDVQLEIYNSLGQRVALLDRGYKPAGIYTNIWNARDNFAQGVSSGIYFCKLKAGRQERLIKMMLLQ